MSECKKYYVQYSNCNKHIKDGANVTIEGDTITSDASGANGIFCYGGNGGKNGATGDGTTLTIRNTTITTTGSGSDGIMTTGGGITYAYDLDVTTLDQFSAPIRNDCGGMTAYQLKTAFLVQGRVVRGKALGHGS